jgi:predicted site-specific integrase-resolvase
MKYITARQFMKKYAISKQTLRNWRINNTVDFIRVGKSSYLYYPEIKSTSGPRIHVAYTRVSDKKQESDLISQQQLVQDFVIKQGYPVQTISDIASGMNENRKGFNELLDLVMSGNVDTVYVTYRDRLTRFGFDYFTRLFDRYNTKIVVINDAEITPFETELTQDLISIIHHFSMKMYSNRRKVLKSAKKCLIDAVSTEQA